MIALMLPIGALQALHTDNFQFVCQMDDFVLCFLDQNVQPFAKVHRHHVHQAELSYFSMTSQFKFFGAQENELHLNEQ